MYSVSFSHSRDGILSGPVALVVSSFKSVLKISSSVTCTSESNKQVGDGEGGCDCTSGSSELNTDIKYLLNMSAIPEGVETEVGFDVVVP